MTMTKTPMLTMPAMRIEARAKLNFTLEVLGVREDGYHALRSLVVPISLADEISIDKSATLESDVPYPDDLCLKAARVLGVTGAKISVVKRIPAGGGLGGGSADAAATMILLNGLYGLGHTREGLARLAAQVGSDVPSLVHGGAVLMEGRGETVSKWPSMPVFDVVLANPGVASSTKEVYANCVSRVTSDDEILYTMKTALESGSVEAVAKALQNDLEASAIGLHPEIAAAKKALLDAGAIGASMSGSGSTVFGLARNGEAARKIASSLSAGGLSAWAAKTCPFV